MNKFTALLLTAVLMVSPLSASRGRGNRPEGRPGSHPAIRAPRTTGSHRDPEAYRHIHGGRFDRDYFYVHYGWNHPLRPIWVGDPWVSFFWMDGVEFQIYGTPEWSVGVESYIVMDEYGNYFIVSPAYPDRYPVVIVF